MTQGPKGKATSQEAVAGQRLDRWLWFARVAKTRTLSAGLVCNGRVRVNRERVTKPAHTIRVGDVVTVSVTRGVRVLKVASIGQRRGPACEAAELFEEIVGLPGGQYTPAATPGAGKKRDGADQGHPDISQQAGPVTLPGAGRPTKKDRRLIDRLRERG